DGGTEGGAQTGTEAGTEGGRAGSAAAAEPLAAAAQPQAQPTPAGRHLMAVSTTQPWFRSFALCTLASLALPGVAAAQGVAPEDATAEQRDQASEAFREGRTAFDERRFSDAITGFRASY